MKVLNALFFLSIVLALGIQCVHASSMQLLEYSWTVRFVTEYSGDSTQLSWFIMSSVSNHLLKLFDEEGNHLSRGATSVQVDQWTEGARTYLKFKMHTDFCGMSTSNSIVASHAITIAKECFSLILGDVQARSDTGECYPVISKLWEGVVWETSADLIYVIEYNRDGSILKEYYEGTNGETDGGILPKAYMPIIFTSVAILSGSVVVAAIYSLRRKRR